MKDVTKISKVYFIGIGGIGMSALARYFHSLGKVVMGYDRTRTALTEELEEMGIDVHYSDDLQKAPMDADLIVYTPAVPSTHQELRYFSDNGYPVAKRSDVLQWITQSSYNICVAGTHGKTTITTMIAHILRDSGYGCNAFLGGISVNYKTNFWSSERNVCVIEADEYDRSFLKLSPDVAVITAIDADHLDIYGTRENVEDAFIQFSKKIKSGGCLVSKFGLDKTAELKCANHFVYSLSNAAADTYAADIRIEKGAYTYDIRFPDGVIDSVTLHMGGLHNVENSIAAATVARYLGIPGEKIKAAIGSFSGVKRRFEYIMRNEKHVLIDDYAHHPAELQALLTGVKSLYPTEPCTVVFQPHLYTRTRDLADQFAESLDLADEVILLPVYPARELPIEGVSSNLILGKMELDKKKVLDKDSMLSWVKEHRPRLLVLCGAGDIDALVDPVKKILEADIVQ